LRGDDRGGYALYLSGRGPYTIGTARTLGGFMRALRHSQLVCRRVILHAWLAAEPALGLFFPHKDS